jgi:hypothetical protein
MLRNQPLGLLAWAGVCQQRGDLARLALQRGHDLRNIRIYAASLSRALAVTADAVRDPWRAAHQISGFLVAPAWPWRRPAGAAGAEAWPASSMYTMTT